MTWIWFELSTPCLFKVISPTTLIFLSKYKCDIYVHANMYFHIYIIIYYYIISYIYIYVCMAYTEKARGILLHYLTFCVGSTPFNQSNEEICTSRRIRVCWGCHLYGSCTSPSDRAAPFSDAPHWQSPASRWCGVLPLVTWISSNARLDDDWASYVTRAYVYYTYIRGAIWQPNLGNLAWAPRVDLD